MDKDVDVTAAQVRPVILSGGAGTRLWPVSRLAFPKQLLPIASDESMLQATAGRVNGTAFSAPLVVADEEHRFFIKDQLEKIGLASAGIILEPEGRNTAAAIALAAQWASRSNPEDVLLVLPSDHVVRDVAALHRAIDAALPVARRGGLVTFGIQPDRPHTGYGYIEIGEPLDNENGVARLSRFVEKPDAATAQRYLDSGNYAWNSGMFLFRADAILRALHQHEPGIARAVAAASEGFEQDGLFVRPDKDAFCASPSISVDVAVMERTSDGFVLPVDLGWSDVGSWESLWEIAPKDGDGNVVNGPVVAIDSADCLIRSEHDKLVVTLGLRRIGVVATRDAILVTDLDRSQDVKDAVDVLRAKGETAAIAASEVFRPWGSYQTIDEGERFQTKRLVVNPGASLSLQKHHHRSEHWVVVRGTAEVTVGETVSLLQENESTYIPAGTIHRLANPGKVPLHLIEVQCGPYLGEDDITRIEDNYGRG